MSQARQPVSVAAASAIMEQWLSIFLKLYNYYEYRVFLFYLPQLLCEATPD